ncbi:hypothetical protein FACS1894172_14340 [Spirochaetia bacterium]|nr:hypothetical protein FACS1894164_13420 [Spirochaetia bacterium]GHU34288.1 hypothetical protein FACS1894172_14340 [Spirochaetia bacterium]
MIGSIENHRSREAGSLVYPVYSRRSGGLSIGINLFPAEKVCPFNCPYCEVFPFHNDAGFSIKEMEKELVVIVEDAKSRNIPIRDICFSGNGEPTISPDFPDALGAAAWIRNEKAYEASIVVITSGAGLIDSARSDVLVQAATGPDSVHVWLKVDAGTEEWYRVINRSAIPFADVCAGIRDFCARAPAVVQTMLCAVDAQIPSEQESESWVKLVSGLDHIEAIQIYGKCRPAPEDPCAEPVPLSFLEARAERIRKQIAPVPVFVFF